MKRVILVIIIWTFIVGTSLTFSILNEKKENRRLAFETAKAFFQQLVITRAWNASHNGVYVPITSKSIINKYLDPELREISTDKGIKLTKINPAYMTRQISEIVSKNRYDIQFHITSLKPIRPQNKATEWEKKWLLSFEKGTKERGDFFYDNKTSFFRYMAPLKVGKSCLSCHQKQGYAEGDIRGGISITLQYFSETYGNISLIAGYLIAGFIGIFLILSGGMLLVKERHRLEESNKNLEAEIDRVNTLSGIVPICMHCKGIRDDKGYWNKLEDFISKHSFAEFSHGICDKCLEEHYPELDDDTEE